MNRSTESSFVFVRSFIRFINKRTQKGFDITNNEVLGFKKLNIFHISYKMLQVKVNYTESTSEQATPLESSIVHKPGGLAILTYKPSQFN